MARHKKLLLEPESELQIDISSMVDVCFLLLIYFLVSTTIVREMDLGMKLPPSVPDGNYIPLISSMFIRVDANGTVFSGTGASERMLDTDTSDSDLPLLSSQLELYAQAARSAGDNPLVQIMVDNGTKQQRVMDVMNALAGCGIRAVTFTDIVEI